MNESRGSASADLEEREDIMMLLQETLGGQMIALRARVPTVLTKSVTLELEITGENETMRPRA